MGCGGSSDGGNAARRVRSRDAINLRGNKGMIEDVKATNMIFFDELLANTSKIALPTNLSPIVCATKYCFPLFATHVSIENAHSKLFLPAVSVSVENRARIICFPHINYLQKSIYNLQDTKQFLSNCFHFLSISTRPTQSCISIGFDSKTNMFIEEFFQSIGFSVEFSEDFPSDLSQYKLMLVPSSFDLLAYQKNLNDFLNESRGLAVFFDENQNGNLFKANDYLSKKGLSYVPISVDLGSSAVYTSVSNDFNSLSDISFITIIQKFKSSIHQKVSADRSFVDRIRLLQFHVAAFSQYFPAETQSCFRSCIRYLDRNKFINDKKEFCQNEAQQQIASLALSISETIPPENCVSLSGHDVFPGIAQEDLIPSDYSISVDVSPEKWTSTGLWLKPGSPVEVQFDDDTDFDGLLIQVGSHTENLTEKPIPWKRWPIVVRTFSCSEKTTCISTSTGGIIYLCLESGKKERTVNCTFYSVVQYPRAVIDVPTIWDETCFYMVPWTEFECGNVIFTLPTDISRELDSQWVLQSYSAITKTVYDFFKDIKTESDKTLQEKDFRVVFDVDMTEDTPICGYPIVFLTKSAPKILSRTSIPTADMFFLVSLFVLSYFKEFSFSPSVEIAVSYAISYHLLISLFPETKPFSFDDKIVSHIYSKLLELMEKEEQKEIVLSTLKQASTCSEYSGDQVLVDRLNITLTPEEPSEEQENAVASF